MDLRVSSGLLNSLYASGGTKQQPRPDSSQSQPDSDSTALATTRDNNGSGERQTTLLNRSEEETDGGLRRTSTFQQADGRTFTKIEDITANQNSVRRAVIQQNPSGNITRYEEVLDRQPGGTFRRTQRFQDESGDVSTQITPDYQVTDPFVLTGGAVASVSPQTPFTPLRGTQLDLQA